MSSSVATSSGNLGEAEAEALAQRYRNTRAFSETIAQPLAAEDCVIQSMPDVSPTRWHLAHTTWFFETFLLQSRAPYKSFDDSFDYLFNSYYNTVGKQFPRAQRGLLSRPTVAEIFEYRKHVDQAVREAIASGELTAQEISIIEIGLNHEQQHQELMITDIKHVLSCNPLSPVYSATQLAPGGIEDSMRFAHFAGGIERIGHEGPEFSYDNESPRHQVLTQPFELADRLVTAGEYLEFMVEGGYQDPSWWLSLGWNSVQEKEWCAPLYWREIDDEWMQFTLSGLVPIDLNAPVCHVSYFEADAYARWAGLRLPSEAEWEIASNQVEMNASSADQLIESGRTVHPAPIGKPYAHDSSSSDDTSTPDLIPQSALRQMFGETWEWTSSPYTPYPGYCPPDGALGEYNGKFMCGQYVLRGGSCATPSNHLRRTYRNFFPPDTRWQFSGIRLAKDAT